MSSSLTLRINAIQHTIGIPQTGAIDLATCRELEKRGNITVNSDNLITHIKNVQRMVNADDDGIIGPQTITRIEAFISDALPKLPGGGSLIVSIKSLDMIVAFEISSKEIYDRKYQSPIWPGGASGITIGIGYDLGFYTKKQVEDAWGPHISPGNLQLLLGVRGIKGQAAKIKLASVQSVKIPFVTANKVFYQSTLPSFAREVKRIYPGVQKLPPDAQGALLSLVYNRGADVNPVKDRRKEMFNIKAFVSAGDLQGIAREIRNMKRLWPDVKGLRDRRDKEADLVVNASFNILPENQVIV